MQEEKCKEMQIPFFAEIEFPKDHGNGKSWIKLRLFILQRVLLVFEIIKI